MPMTHPTTTEQPIEHEGMAFRLRIWWCSAPGGEGWCWTLVSNDATVPYTKSGTRTWVTREGAVEAARDHLARTF
jgi:hypothetical protein